MKKTGVIVPILCCLILCGCTKTEPTWEYVRDSLLTEAPLENAEYCISFDVPTDAILEESDADSDRRIYRQKDGDYEIISQTIGSCDLETVVRELSGFSPERVSVLHTTRYGMEECHFVWCSDTEQGMTISRADVLLSAPYSYALTFSANEDSVLSCTDAQAKVFSSFSLFENEGF